MAFSIRDKVYLKRNFTCFSKVSLEKFNSLRSCKTAAFSILHSKQGWHYNITYTFAALATQSFLARPLECSTFQVCGIAVSLLLYSKIQFNRLGDDYFLMSKSQLTVHGHVPVDNEESTWMKSSPAQIHLPGGVPASSIAGQYLGGAHKVASYLLRSANASWNHV